MSRSSGREGIAGIVNELLIQLQSFDHPTKTEKLHGFVVDRLNNWLPDHRQLSKGRSTAANVLIIGATNRADDLDPALLRPGRFDRSVHFDLPTRTGRREIIDYYLDRKAHEAELDRGDRRDALAAMTSGYSPVMIEHLFDEGLVWALRDEREAMSWTDIQQAKFTEEIGLKQPVEYTEGEKRRIATHEGGHAVVAHLVADRNLEVLSIIKRRGALGLLAHSDAEERFTRTEDELKALMAIAFGGMVAEELAFGAASTGPAGDLTYATRWRRRWSARSAWAARSSRSMPSSPAAVGRHRGQGAVQRRRPQAGRSPAAGGQGDGPPAAGRAPPPPRAVGRPAARAQRAGGRRDHRPPGAGGGRPRRPRSRPPTPPGPPSVRKRPFRASRGD